MNNHETIRLLLSAYLDNAVSPFEQEQVEKHLDTCPQCRAELDTLRKVSTVLPYWKDQTISPDLEQKIRKRIFEAQEQKGVRDMQERKMLFDKKRLLTIGQGGGVVLVLLLCLVISQEYMRKGLQGKFQVGVNSIGDQFDPATTSAIHGKIAGEVDYSMSEPSESFDRVLGPTSDYAKTYSQSTSSARKKLYDAAPDRATDLFKSHGTVGNLGGSYSPAYNGLESRVTSVGTLGALNNTSVVAGAPATSLGQARKQGYVVYPEQRYAPRYYYMAPQPQDTFFQDYGVNPFVNTKHDHFSTFAIDVDTASYTVSRQYIQKGTLPPKEAVRVEEFVNYFEYQYPAPESGTFAVYAEGAPSAFRADTYQLRLGIKGKEVHDFARKPAILTFVVDVSGSMSQENRLGLVKRALRMLVDQLQSGDQIGIIAYSDHAWVELYHVGIEHKYEILGTIDRLYTRASTNVEQGLRAGYEIASQAFKQGYINRVILLSDGVANTGMVQPENILRQVKMFTDRGIMVTSVGVGMENYNDVLLERIGDKGNGRYIHIDSIEEAKKSFVDDLTGQLQFIAKDVKIQIDFNPKVVREYRLIGYENRDVQDHQFRNDRVDGGEIGAGHATTALYELNLNKVRPNDVIGTVYIRYKHVDTSEVKELATPITARQLVPSFERTTASYKLSVAVAEFAEILRQSYWARGSSIQQVRSIVQGLLAEYRNDAKVSELLSLIESVQNRIPAPVYYDEEYDHNNYPVGKTRLY